eukprot:6711448-Prymnesium_polylepis.1
MCIVWEESFDQRGLHRTEGGYFRHRDVGWRRSVRRTPRGAQEADVARSKRHPDAHGLGVAVQARFWRGRGVELYDDIGHRRGALALSPGSRASE